MAIFAAILAAAMPLRTRADYTVTLQSDHSSARVVKVGESFDLDATLTSTAPWTDENWSAALRIEFSSSGLRLDQYAWSVPFTTAGVDDVSVPALKKLPVIIRADTVPDGAGAAGRVDLFFSNFTDAAQGYRIGRILRLRLAVPAAYAGADRIQIQVVPESFGNGFAVIPAKVGEPFQLQIAPAEGAAQSPLSVSIQNGLVSLTWPASIQGATLQTATDLGGEWTDFSATPDLVDGRNRVQLFSNTGARPVFFRLRFP